MISENKVVFSGTFVECMRHFSSVLQKVFPSQRKRAVEKRNMSNYLEVTEVVFNNACKGVSNPTFKNLLKISYFLNLLGYDVEEFRLKPKQFTNFAELIAFKQLSFEDAYTLLGYKAESSLIDVFKGVEGVSDKKKEMMWDMWKARRESLEKEKERLRKKFQKISKAVHGVFAGEITAENLIEPTTEKSVTLNDMVNTVHQWTNLIKSSKRLDFSDVDSNTVLDIAHFWSNFALRVIPK